MTFAIKFSQILMEFVIYLNAVSNSIIAISQIKITIIKIIYSVIMQKIKQFKQVNVVSRKKFHNSNRMSVNKYKKNLKIKENVEQTRTANSKKIMNPPIAVD